MTQVRVYRLHQFSIFERVNRQFSHGTHTLRSFGLNLALDADLYEEMLYSGFNILTEVVTERFDDGVEVL